VIFPDDDLAFLEMSCILPYLKSKQITDSIKIGVCAIGGWKNGRVPAPTPRPGQARG